MEKSRQAQLKAFFDTVTVTLQERTDLISSLQMLEGHRTGEWFEVDKKTAVLLDAYVKFLETV